MVEQEGGVDEAEYAGAYGAGGGEGLVEGGWVIRRGRSTGIKEREGAGEGRGKGEGRGGRGREGTYSPPVKKIAETPNFLGGDICRCHIRHSGTKNIAKSDTVLNAPEDIYSATIFRHFPDVLGCQIFSRGWHATIGMIV